MKRKRHSEEQTVSILNEREAGASVADLARKHGVAERPVHRWKSKYGGMTAPGLKRLKRRVRRTCACSVKAADPGLDHADARGRHRNVKKALTPAAKRKAAGSLRSIHPASERRTCRLLGMHRSTARSRPEPGRGGGPLADRLRELARRHPRYGYLTLHHMLKREGLAATRKRKRRVYSRLGLQVRTKRRRRPQRPRVRMAAPTRPNERWSIDFLVRPAGQRPALAHPRRRRRLLRDVRQPAGGHPGHGGPAGALPGRAGQGLGDAPRPSSATTAPSRPARRCAFGAGGPARP